MKRLKIQTKYHGEVEIEESKIIHFQQGIPSFLDQQQFYILPFADEGPFLIMQSVQTPALAFVIVSPFDFFKDYEVKLTEQVIDALEIERQEDTAVFVILTIADSFHNSTANLQGPIIINDVKKLGKQVILSDSPYRTKHVLLDQHSQTGKGE